MAKACGVHHGSVSRYLKICCELGYLTEDYTFTERGKTWLAGYQRLLSELPGFPAKSRGSGKGDSPECEKSD